MKEKTVQELQQMRNDGSDFQLIDVREEWEFETANINGELIPLGHIMDEQDKISKSKPVIIHCRSGSRSTTAVKALEQLGYTNLYNLKGGIMAWKNEIDPTLDVS
ncbi:MAG: rhodanese-like domain-containing protein [Bacteroidia bacterium]|nr:rhodanese-like domain-containing protein [Bacteroidia bacterium]HQV00845.1 rhodanese-like domain-containing protein [Bacteroidia bacterium]